MALDLAYSSHPITTPLLPRAPRERSGGASGMLGTARLLGQSSGAALVALMLNQFGDNGTHVSLMAAAILAVIAACVSGLRITQPRARGIINILRHSRRFFKCAYKALLPAAP